jgi:hypothetical protein
MNSRAIALFAVSVSLTGPLSAITYRGEITYTLTSVSSWATGLNIGDEFTGWYSYESPTIDGTFVRDQTPEYTPPLSLTGALYVPAPLAPEMAGGNSFISFPGDQLSALGCLLTVADGVVTDFNWGPEYGPWALTVTESYFSAFRLDLADEPSTRGRIVFSAPTPSVPDITSTASLLAIALFGLGWLRRRQH